MKLEYLLSAVSLLSYTAHDLPAGLLDEEEDEETFVSNYEKQHPLEVPRALTEVRRDLLRLA